MQTEAVPCIAILLAVYDPNPVWLRLQLQSLEQQSYGSLTLLVRDDASPHLSEGALRQLLSDTITKLPWQLIRNPVNMGSTGTFEALTRDALALPELPAFLAYCDQDDVWLPDKLTSLYEAMQTGTASLICSDLQVIDENGTVTAESITEARPRHILKSGSDLFPDLIYNNFVMGCTMLIRAEAAKAALPFPSALVHDHWLALCCAKSGEIGCIRRPLIQYRVHSASQTAVLTGIRSKEDYYRRKLEPFLRRAEVLAARLPCRETEEALRFAAVREQRRLRKPGSRKALRALRRLDPKIALFEEYLPGMPEPLFRLAVHLIRKGTL